MIMNNTYSDGPRTMSSRLGSVNHVVGSLLAFQSFLQTREREPH